MTVEERFGQVDFSQFSKVKDSLLLRLKLRRRAINEERAYILRENLTKKNPVNKKIPRYFVRGFFDS